MIVKNFQSDFGALPNTNVLAMCQSVSKDIALNPYMPYKLIIPAGDYYLSDTWEIAGSGQTVIIEAEVGTAFGTIFHPFETFDPLVILGSNYVPFVRLPGGLNDSFTTTKDPNFMPAGYDPVKQLHLDYRPLIRLRALGEGSTFRGIVINGRDNNKVARLGKGLWIDGLWHGPNGTPDDEGYDAANGTIKPGWVFYGSNGLLIDSCKVNSVHAVLERTNTLVHPTTDTYPWLPGIAIQAASASSDNATRQISNVRIHRSYVFGALGGLGDPFLLRTDLGIFFAAGNMKNYMVSECNIGFCRYGVRTAGSGYTNVIGCDLAANGAFEAAHWDDGADFLVPQAQVNIIGCGSEGSRRLVQGDGAPGQGFGALNIDGCYWDGILAVDRPADDVGYVIRNLNQAGYIRGLRVVTGGPQPGRAGRAGIQIHGIVRSLVLVNSHIDGEADPLKDPPIYEYSNFLPPLLGQLAGYDKDDVRILVQNCTSRGYSGGFPTAVVPLQNYDFSSVKRIGGNSVKVTLVDVPGDKVLEAWHHTIVADATQGNIKVLLPLAVDCRGREYVIKRLDKMPNANSVSIESVSSDTLDGAAIQVDLKNLQFRRIVSTGTLGWAVVGQ